MKATTLVLRGLTYYWRTNVAVVAGVATAVAVLAGALLVGDSVRGSLRDLVLQRLGRTDRVLVSSGFFREALADDIRAGAAPATSSPASGMAVTAFEGVCPMIAVEGLVRDQVSGRRASRVRVYGVDDRFWRFHGLTGGRGPEGREALVSRALAADIGATAGGTVLVRVERASAIPIESLHARKDDLGRTMRLAVRAIVGPADLGEFSLRPEQGEVRAVFVPLKRLQQDLDIQGRVNTLLVADGGGAPGSPERLALRRAGGNTLEGARGFPPSLKLRRTVEALAEAGQPSGPNALEAAIRQRFALDDVGLTIRVVPSGVPDRLKGSPSDPRSARLSAFAEATAERRNPGRGWSAESVLAVESAAGFLDPARATAVEQAAAGIGMTPQPILTYLANSLRSGDRQVPYSLVTAIDLAAVIGVQSPVGRPSEGRRDGDAERALLQTPPIVLNEWAARDLAAKAGDPLTLEYYLWEEPGRLVTRTAEFRIAAVVPIEGAAADRDLAPAYPGITEAESLGDWDPPFPIDLRRVRPVDEQYWKRYRTTPKAFIPIEVGQALWRSRYGDRTSVRLAPPAGTPGGADAWRDRYAARLRETIDPLALGLAVRDVRAEGLAASRGATDFGEYFTYFSFFLVASALLLAALFFRLSVEQRAREVGLLRAVGFSTARVRVLFAGEGLLLAAAGSMIGMAGAVGYAGVMMIGLRTWWTGAVVTKSLTLHVAPASLAAGAIGALAAAMACIWWTLRGLARVSERSLLAGQVALRLDVGHPLRGAGIRRPLRGAVSGATAFAVLGLAMMAAAAAGALDRTGAFFGAGTALLVACLCLVTIRLRVPPRSILAGHGWRAIARLGLRNAADRPGRSVLAIGVIASAAFILISVDAFRREGPAATDRRSGVGGYPLLVNLLLPIPNDPNSREGREALGLGAFDRVTVEPFRVRPGDDASCLNLYEPTNPRILGARASFIGEGRFAFRGSIAATDAERANPWLLLHRNLQDGAVPIVADANSITYVLHKTLGADVLVSAGGRPVRLRLVASLADSIFQGELLMSDANFLRLFPGQEGYQFLLIETPADRTGAVAAAIEEGAADLGAGAVSTVDRLAEFHTVENTYLSTFKTLGGLGLLVGTVGLAAVLLRNVLERRRELALLGATGYRRGHIFAIIVAENALLLAWGLAAGAVSAVVAIAPAVVERGGRLPATADAVLLLIAVFAAGLVSSAVATSAALRTPLLDALRAE